MSTRVKNTCQKDQGIYHNSHKAILFVHGTGVRKEGYFNNCALIKQQLTAYRLSYDFETCFWGDLFGANNPPKSVPSNDYSKYSKAKTVKTDEGDLSLWMLLREDPLFELRFLLTQSNSQASAMLSSQRRSLWNRISSYQISPTLFSLFKKYGMVGYWDTAYSTVIQCDYSRKLLLSSDIGPGDSSLAIARSIIALLTQLTCNNYTPTLTRDQRDLAIKTLIDDWRGRFAGISEIAGHMLASIVTPWASHNRLQWTGAASLFVGDILRYQAHGERVRDFIQSRIINLKSEVVVLAHSLGGIACVELLIQKSLPQVTHLITAGSQAPYLYEIDALSSLSYRAKQPLPTHFPRWLNLYDDNDFLSYVAEPLFTKSRVCDVRVNSGQPFPVSHSAYWSNDLTWKAIRPFLG